MTININLFSEGSVQNAISRLKVRLDHLEEDTEQLVDILTEEGAEIAQSAYGDWGVAAVPMTEGTTGNIVVYGDNPLIAEFGAGDATLNPASLFENSPETDVFPGSYSRENAQQYWKWGVWYFGGEVYREVEPRMGLAQAKAYIIENATDIAKEVMAYD